MMGSSDSESEDERRVVKSAKAKASEELVNICNEIRGNMDGNEWAAIQTLWDKLHKQVDKLKKTSGMLGTPRPYVKILADLEDFLNQTLEGTSVDAVDCRRDRDRCVLSVAGFWNDSLVDRWGLVRRLPRRAAKKVEQKIRGVGRIRTCAGCPN